MFVWAAVYLLSFIAARAGRTAGVCVGFDPLLYLTAFVLAAVIAAASGHYNVAADVVAAAVAVAVAWALPPAITIDVGAASVAYTALMLALPTVGGTLLAARAGGPASERFGTAWAALALYALGFVAAGGVRARSPVAALFVFAFPAFWGLSLGLLFVPLLLAGIVGFGGCAAAIRYFWDPAPPPTYRAPRGPAIT